MEDGLLTAYLLGRLSPEEEEGVEMEYFRAGDAYDRLLAAEDDLIDAYAAGRLEPDDARRFHEHFLSSPARRERVAFAQALRTVAMRAAPAASRPRSFVWPVAAALLVTLATGWLFVSDLRTELARSREEQSSRELKSAKDQALIASLKAELESARSASGIETWNLAPGYERDATPPAIETAPTVATAVCLRLTLGTPVPRGPFSAKVQTAEGRVVAELHSLRVHAGESGGPVVDVVVPAASLRPGTHVVILEVGRPPEQVETYRFRVAAP